MKKSRESRIWESGSETLVSSCFKMNMEKKVRLKAEATYDGLVGIASNMEDLHLAQTA